MERHQKRIIPIDVVKENKNWLEYLFNEADPQHSAIRCRLCHKYYDKFNLPKRYKNSLANEKGTLKESKSDNKKLILEHANIPGHKAVVQKLQGASAKRFDI